MTRQEHLDASGLSSGEVDILLDAIAAVAPPVHLAYLWRPALRDPDDDMVLEAAINGQADAIVTFNLRDFDQAAMQFGVKILSPGNALRQLDQQR